FLFVFTSIHTTAVFTLSLHDALPIFKPSCVVLPSQGSGSTLGFLLQRFPSVARSTWMERMARSEVIDELGRPVHSEAPFLRGLRDRKSTRLNSSHVKISYAVFCFKKK